MRVFESVLVANRGEIAVRIMRTLHAMGIRAIAVYSDADADALHVRMADEAVRLGPASAAASYLSVERIIDAARVSGAQAIHPGYGFLSENADLARACEEAGIVFIGPPIPVLHIMGDKIRAKRTAIDAGVPVVPGRHDADMDDAALVAAIAEIGLPALLKPSAGGGGKGMRIVRDGDDPRALIASARREAQSSFGDDTLLVERFLSCPRHIEVQVLADTQGNVVHLGERECTLQRRHQKVIEESPSLVLNEDVRAALCDSAVRLAASVGYVGAGTVEYVVSGDDPGSFSFLEMNTRLQVEHPVTEMVTGIDLVEWQVRIAAGEELAIRQPDIRPRGHAIEARIYAEDPARGFVPTGGEVLLWHAPPTAGAHVRTDSGIATGSHVGSDYDPMLAKIIVHAPSREQALARLGEALDATVLLGVTSNIDFLRDLVADPDVRAGEMDTGLIDRRTAFAPPAPSPEITRAAVLASAMPESPTVADVWRIGDNWRLAGAAPIRAYIDGTLVEVGHDVLATDAVARVAADGSAWVHAPGAGTHRLVVTRPIDRQLKAHHDRHGDGAWEARSPMPGALIAVLVDVGDVVEAGAALAVVEAMKMEHTLRAPATGVITWVGDAEQVRLDEALVQMEIS